jgi:hypothetical protein
MVKRFLRTRSPRGPTSSVGTFSENFAAPSRRLVEAFIAGERTAGIARLDAMEVASPTRSAACLAAFAPGSSAL